MARHQSTQAISSQERSLPFVDPEDKLSKWFFFSFLFHGVLILALFVVPFLPDSSRPSYPIYTVDLVGGEKIGGNNLGTELVPPAASKAAPKKGGGSPPAQEAKQETKKEKPKPIEKDARLEEKVALKEAAKKEPPKKDPTKDTKSEAKTDESALDRVRER